MFGVWIQSKQLVYLLRLSKIELIYQSWTNSWFSHLIKICFQYSIQVRTDVSNIISKVSCKYDTERFGRSIFPLPPWKLVYNSHLITQSNSFGNLRTDTIEARGKRRHIYFLYCHTVVINRLWFNLIFFLYHYSSHLLWCFIILRSLKKHGALDRSRGLLVAKLSHLT